MSLLYYGSLSSFSGDTWKAEIRDTSGVITTGTELVLAGNGIVFKYDGDGDEFYTNPLRSSSVSVFFNVDDSTDETFFENLSIQNEGDKAILIYKNNVLYWVGRILPDINQYDRKKLVNTQFEVVATDTLGILDQYTVDKTWFTDDKINGIDLVTQILTVTGIETFWDQVGVSEFFADGLFTYNVDSGSSDHLIDYQFNYLSFYKDVSALLTEIYPNFEGTITCKEALENILKVFNGRMILSDGMYFITSPQSYSAGTNIVYDIYDTTGTLITNNASFVHGVNIGTTDRPKWEDFPVTTAQPALREIKTILKNKIAFKYDFRDVNNPSNAQLSVDDFDFSVGDDDIRVMANLVADGRQLRNQIQNYIFQGKVLLKYRVFAWNGTTALFWDWQNAAFRDPSPADNGWRYKDIAFTSLFGYKRREFNIEFDQTYSSNVGSTGLATGYTLYAEFEVVHRVYRSVQTGDYTEPPLEFGGYVRIYQGRDTPIEVVTTNDTVSPIASKKEEVYMPYWDIDLKESIYTIKVWNGTNWVLPNNWVSFNSFSGRMENAFAKNVMSMYNKALVVTQGNWIDAGDYDVIKSLSFDSKTWLFNGGTFYPYSEQFDGEWLCIDDDTTGINVGSDDDLQEGDLNDQENLQLKIGKEVWNDLGENVTEYDKHLPYLLVNSPVEPILTTPGQNTEYAVKINFNSTDSGVRWNLAELGKAVTVTSDETVTDTSVQIFDVDTALGSINLTLPTPSDVKGREYVVKKSHPANTVTVTGTIDGSGSYLLDYENESVVLVSNGLEYVVKSEYGKDDLTDVTNRNNTTDNTVGVGALQLDLTPSATPTAGMLYWDEDEETAAIQVNGINYEIGQGLYWVAKNQTGLSIPKGTAVYASGTLGASGRILISPMIANGTIEAKYFLGITAEDIANGDDGKVITQGKVRQIDTSGYTVGSVLWVSSSTAGALTSTQPTGSNLALAVAFVVESASNGVMAVRVSVLDENAIGGTTPTLDEVTTAGNTTTNDIEVGDITIVNTNGSNPTDAGSLYFSESGSTWGTNLYGFRINQNGSNNTLNIQSANLTTVNDILTITRDTARVGIGTSSPANLLHVEGSGYVAKFGDGTRFLRLYTDAGEVSLLADGSVPMRFYTGGSERMRILTNGNVLIGTTTDNGYKLQINGDATINGVRVGRGAGNVDGNTVLGSGAFNSNSTGLQNTAIGYQSLRNNTGQYNVAVGYQAGYSNTSGERNTAVGRQALRANSTGSYNVALGMNALDSNTASNNTALGYQAGYSNTTGSIVAIGYLAGFSNTTGSSTTAIGFQALKNNTTSSSNTAVGLNSLVNTTGNSNTAIGTYAGDANTTGSNNIFIGKDSDGVSATDSNRTFIGNSSTTSTWVGGNLLVGTTTDAGTWKTRIQGQYPLQLLNSSGTAKFEFYADSNEHRYLNGAKIIGRNQDLSIDTNSSSYDIILAQSGGSVGIGTSSPATLLHSNNGSASPNSFRIENSDGYGQITTDSNVLTYDAQQHLFNNRARSSEYMRINASGNVLIGTTTDLGYKLRVNGSALFTNWVRVNGDDGIYFQDRGGGWRMTDTTWLRSYNDKSIYTGGGAYFGSSVGIGTSSPQSELHLNSSTTESILHITNSSTGATLSDGLRLGMVGTAAYFLLRENAAMLFHTNNTERMRIANTGNVLIGTTTDSGAKLDIGGNIRFTNSATDNYITTDSNASKLRFFGGSSNSVTNGAALTLNGHTNTGDAGVADLASTSAGFIRFRIGTTEKMRLTSAGNLGISNTSPSYNLDVTGDINATSNYYHNGVQGYTGTVTIQQPAPQPPINIDINGGIITNVY